MNIILRSFVQAVACARISSHCGLS